MREFLRAQFHDDPLQNLRFYAYLPAKVKLIRIETPSVLTEEVENLMFAYLITNTPTRDYERSLAEGARQLRKISDADFTTCCNEYFTARKSQLSREFGNALGKMYSWDTRAFRLRYMLAKLTQAIDVRAYGDGGNYGT